jgi:hypothetical protein
MSEIWTGDVRRVLYRRLVEQFGPFDKWERASSPGGGNDENFNQFCEDFARVVGAKSGEAVKHQIRFAMPESGSGSSYAGGHAQTAILNKAAALEAGFIENKHLPKILRASGPEPPDEAF